MKIQPLRYLLSLLFLFSGLTKAQDDGFGFFSKFEPKAAETNLFILELNVAGFQDLFDAEPEDPFAPFGSEVELKGQDVLNFIRRLGGKATSARSDGDTLTVVGTREELRVIDTLFTPLCCAPMQVRLSLSRLMLPAKALQKVMRDPERLHAEVLKQFSEGEGELVEAVSVIGLSGVEAVLKDYAITPTVAPDFHTMNLGFEYRIAPDTRTTFTALNQVPQLLTTELVDDAVACLIFQGTLIGPSGEIWKEREIRNGKIRPFTPPPATGSEK